MILFIIMTNNIDYSIYCDINFLYKLNVLLLTLLLCVFVLIASWSI